MYRICTLTLLLFTACGEIEEKEPTIEDANHDYDRDGFTENQGDCDDQNLGIHPDAEELCDEQDNDCDGIIDSDASDISIWYQDNDLDGYGVENLIMESCERPEGYVSEFGDCKDDDIEVYPDAEELCDEQDNDCDGLVDDEDDDWLTSTGGVFFGDGDADGFGWLVTVVEACVAPLGMVENADDCDDTDELIHPHAPEVCDTIDNDCDFLIDDLDDSVDLTTGIVAFEDGDADGYGDSFFSTMACEVPVGYSAIDGDCNDLDAEIHPLAVEVCDNIDNNCNGHIDIDDPTLDMNTATLYAIDWDSDGFGDSDLSNGEYGCEPLAGYTTDATDCDDSNGAINPGATEVCDTQDNDCNQLTDDDDPGVDLTTGIECYTDSDLDGYGTNSTIMACEAPVGFSSVDGDCDDGDFDVRPGAAEVCDTVDNDCNGLIDMDDDAIDLTSAAFYTIDWDSDGFGDMDLSNGQYGCEQPTGYTTDATDCDDQDATEFPGQTWYADADSDAFGDPATSTNACEQPQGYLLDMTDCDDDDATEFPGQFWYADSDGDEYGDKGNVNVACEQVSGTVLDDTDCDDTNMFIHPAAEEVCDGVDNNCDDDGTGVGIDDSNAVDQTTWYLDGDVDQYGDPDNFILACDNPTTISTVYVQDNTDCDDNNYSVNPGVSEDPTDAIDNDCDGVIEMPTVVCETLDVAECLLESTCTTITAGLVALDEDDICGTESSEVVGCMPSDEFCSLLFAPVYYASPSSPEDCYEFGTGCIPDGWIDCETGASTCETVDCVELDLDECTADGDCAPIYGGALEIDPLTMACEADSLDFIECMDNVGCGDMITYAAPSDNPDDCYEFFDTCVPDDWEDCSVEGLICDSTVTCTDLTPSECALEGDCTVIEGGLMVEDSHGICLPNSNEALGCMPVNTGCATVLTYAASPDNPDDCYEFSDACVPDGWSTCDGSCPPVVCADLNPTECVADGTCRDIQGGLMAEDSTGTCSPESPEDFCIPNNRNCMQVITYAASPDSPDDCYEFSESCVPEDWSTCDGTCATECADLDATECASDTQCQEIFGGLPFMGSGPNCEVDALEFLGCRDTSSICLQATTSAASPANPDDCYEFSDSCVPDGWSVCVDDCEDTSLEQ